MNTRILATAAAFSLSVLSAFGCGGCEALQTLAGPIGEARNFRFDYKELPAGTTVAHAVTMMESGDIATISGSKAYENLRRAGDVIPSGEYFRCRIYQPTSSHRGGVDLQIYDIPTVAGPSDSANSAFIRITPLPAIGDTVRIAYGEIGLGTSPGGELNHIFRNDNNSGSYFRFVLESFDTQNNTASGSFAFVAEGQGSNAGRLFAITNGSFFMNTQ